MSHLVQNVLYHQIFFKMILFYGIFIVIMLILKKNHLFSSKLLTTLGDTREPSLMIHLTQQAFRTYPKKGVVLRDLVTATLLEIITSSALVIISLSVWFASLSPLISVYCSNSSTRWNIFFIIIEYYHVSLYIDQNYFF